MLLWRIVDKYVHDADADHLDAAPYTYDTYMEFSLQRRAKLHLRLAAGLTHVAPVRLS